MEIERKREKVEQKIAIIGAGITGLSSAYFIKQDPTIEVTIFEASNRPEVKFKHIDMKGILLS